jgi:hypothetical protein
MEANMTLFAAATVLQKVHQDNTSCWLCDQEVKRSAAAIADTIQLLLTCQ